MIEGSNQPQQHRSLLHPSGSMASSRHSGSPDALLKQGPPDMRVDGAQRIVQQVDVRILIHRSGHRDSLLLAARQGDASVPDLRQVAVGEDLEVLGQLGGAEGSAVPSEHQIVDILHLNLALQRHRPGVNSARHI